MIFLNKFFERTMTELSHEEFIQNILPKSIMNDPDVQALVDRNIFKIIYSYNDFEENPRLGLQVACKGGFYNLVLVMLQNNVKSLNLKEICKYSNVLIVRLMMDYGSDDYEEGLESFSERTGKEEDSNLLSLLTKRMFDRIFAQKNHFLSEYKCASGIRSWAMQIEFKQKAKNFSKSIANALASFIKNNNLSSFQYLFEKCLYIDDDIIMKFLGLRKNSKLSLFESLLNDSFKLGRNDFTIFIIEKYIFYHRYILKMGLWKRDCLIFLSEIVKNPLANLQMIHFITNKFAEVGKSEIDL